jgi:hypothetical protein
MGIYIKKRLDRLIERENFLAEDRINEKRGNIRIRNNTRRIGRGLN